MASSSSNIFIFFGEDDFSLRQKINLWKQEFAKKFGAGGIVDLDGSNFGESELAKKLEEVLTPSLFASKKLLIARNCLPAKASQEILAAALEDLVEKVPADYFLVFWQDSLDRRLGFIKNLLKKVRLTDFPLPHGRELNAWIKRQAALKNLQLDDAAIEKLAVLSGRDLYEERKAGGKVVERKEFFDLWQIDSELEKLASYPVPVTSKVVGELVVPKVSENVFALSDALVAQDKKKAVEILERLAAEQNVDEKAMGIKLLGLLSEQIRSLLVVNILKNQNMDQNQIANFLGWSPGRVFVTLKNASRIQAGKLKSLLGRILVADIAIKSTDTNPKLLIDLLITQ